MGQAASATAGFHAISAGQLKGSARGALVCACFGSAWMYWAVVLSGHLTPLWFSTVTLPAVVLIALAILRVRAFRRLIPSPAELAHWRRYRRFFWIDVGIEWGLGGASVFLLSRFGRADLIPQVFGVIIGLHFLPLVKIFRAPRLYWTGSIIAVGAVGSLLLPRGEVRNVAGCASIGLTLWATAVIILWRISSASESQSASTIS